VLRPGRDGALRLASRGGCGDGREHGGERAAPQGGATAPHDEREALRGTLIEEQTRTAGGGGRALEIGVVDDVIKQEETRRRIAEALAALPAVRTATSRSDHRAQRPVRPAGESR
jgi:acetyl-CoA carboxylase carboxyltransferase component